MDTIMGGKSHLKGVYVVLFLLLVIGIAFGAVSRFKTFGGSDGFVLSTDTTPLGVGSRTVTLNCNGGYTSKTFTTNSASNGYYSFTGKGDYFFCDGTDAHCTVTCQVYVVDENMASFNFHILNTPRDVGERLNITYPHNLDITGTFSPVSETYGPNFNSFTFTAEPVSGQTLLNCRYSLTNQDYDSMTNAMTKNLNAFTTTSFTKPVESGEYTYYVACETDLIKETSSNTESIIYTFDFDAPVFDSILNATNSYLQSIPPSISIVLNEPSKCQIRTTDTGYNYASTNCTASFTNTIACPLSGLSEGVNNFHIACTDVYGNTQTSTNNADVTYYIDFTKPFAYPNGTTYYFEKGESVNNFINWTLFDNLVSNTAPGAYTIYNNSVFYNSSNNWNVNEYFVELFVDTSSVRTFNYSIYLNDYTGNTNESIIWAIVRDTTPPSFTITSPELLNGPFVSLNLTTSDDDVSQCWTNVTGFNTSMSMNSEEEYGWASVLGNSTYNTRYYCNDTSNNVFYQDKFFMVDALPPSVIKPANQAIDINATVYFDFTVTDLTSEGHYSLNINNTLYTPLNTWIEGTDITILVDSNRGVGLWNYTLFVNDSFNNYDYTSVLISLEDNIPPNIIITNPAPSQKINTNLAMFNITLDEKSLNCDMSINAGLNQSMTKHDVFDYGASSIINDGLHTAEFFCLDDYNNLGYNSISFRIDATAPYIANFTGNTTVSMNKSEYIVWTFADNHAPGQFAVLRDGLLYNNWKGWLNNTQYPVLVNAHDGIRPFNFTVLFNDSYGNMNSDTRIIEVVDDVPPEVIIVSPENKYYNTRTTSLNVTTTEEATDCYYSLNYALNVSMTKITGFDFGIIIDAPEGYNRVVFSCRDASNNFGYNSVDFGVDTEPPFVANKHYNTTVPMNSTHDYIIWTLGDFAFSGDYTVLMNGTEVAGFWTSWSNNTNNFVQVETNSGFGEWNYTILFNDSVNNLASDTVIINVIDNVPPIITILYTDEFRTDNDIELNVTLNEPGNECRYRVNGSLYYPMLKLTEYDFGANQLFSTDGYHIIDYNCTDYYFNWGYNSTSLTLDFNPPYMLNYSTEYFVEINNTVLFNFTIADNVTSTGYYNVTINDELYITPMMWFNNTEFNITIDTNKGLGVWEYTINFNDSNGFSSNFVFSVEIQDTIPPRSEYVFIQNFYDAGNWLFSNQTTLVCAVHADDLWDIKSYEFMYALDDNIWTNMTCADTTNEYCDWIIPRETMPLNISCRAVDSANNTGNYTYNYYAGLDMSSPVINLEPINIINSTVFTISANTFDEYSGVANVTYWYTNTTGSYYIGINNTYPFNYTWIVPEAVENTYINISASCQDFGGWLSEISILENVPVNAVDEPPILIFYSNYLGNGLVLLDATSSYDPDFIVDGVTLNYTYQISGNGYDFTNISGCEETNTTCLWDYTTTTSTCPEYTTCFAMAKVYDNTHVVNSTHVTQYIDYTSPVINTLTPTSSSIMSGTSQFMYCSASDAGDALLNMSLEVFMDQGSGNEWFLLNESESNDLSHDLVFDALWPNQYHNIIIRCNATDDAGNTASAESTGITLDRVGPYFWQDSMSVSNNALLGYGASVTYSIYARDINPGIDQLYFNTSNGLISGSGPVSYNYWLSNTCTSTSMNQYYGVFANDTLGHANATIFETPHTWFCDTSYPDISNCHFNNSGVIYSGESARMNCTVIDVGYSTVDKVLFNSSNGLNFADKQEDYYYEDLTCNISNNGNFLWSNVYANDTLNNMGLRGVNQAIECDALPPIISAPTANTTSGFQEDIICLTVNITDPNTDNVWMELGLPDYSIINATLSPSITGCGGQTYGNTKTYGYELLLAEQGSYNIFNIYANDTGAQFNTIPTVLTIFVFDNLAPIISDITIINGDDTLKAWENATLRATVYDQGINGVDTVLFELSGVNETGIYLAGNYFGYEFKCSDWYHEGSYNLTNVYANDTGGNKAVKSSTISIVCDAMPPRINQVFVNATAVTQHDWFCITADISEAYLDSVWATVYSNNIHQNITLTSPSPCSIGTHGFQYYAGSDNVVVNSTHANDTAGNYNYVVQNHLVTVEESLYPNIKCSVNNTLLKLNDMGRLTCEIRDNEGIDTAWVELEDFVPPGPSTHTNNTLLNDSALNFYYDFNCNVFTGAYNKTIMRVFANDTDSTTHTNYTIMNQKLYCDLNPPIVINPTVDKTQINQFSTVCVNATITDIDSGILSATVEVLTPMMEIISYTLTPSASCALGLNSYGADINLTRPGMHNFTRVIAQDLVYNTNLAWINNTGVLVESVDNTTPIITILSPLNLTYNTPNVTVLYIMNEQYFMNQWYVLNNNLPVYANNVQITNLEPGAHNLTAYIQDTYNNIGSASVIFTVNDSVGSADLRVESLEVPSETIAGIDYILTTIVSNKGTVDVLNATIHWLINGAIFSTEYTTLLVNTTRTLSYDMNLLKGYHNITVVAVPVSGETNLLDNSRTRFTQTVNLIDKISVSMSAPSAVAPNTNFVTRIYEYQNLIENISVMNALSAPSFTINGPSSNLTNLYNSTIVVVTYNLTSPAITGNYTLTTNTWVPIMPGNKTLSSNVEVRQPGSPIFSISVAVVPDFFIVGLTNTVFADIYNYGNETAHNVNATINLPSGLNLVSGDLTQVVGDIPAGSFSTVEWSVTPDYAGSFSISVSAVCDEDFAESSSGSEPILSLVGVEYDKSVEVNENTTLKLVFNNQGARADNVELRLVLGNNMTGVPDFKTINVSAHVVNYTTFINFTTSIPGNAQQFKVTMKHAGSGFYEEYFGSINAWADTTPPSGVPTVTGYSTIEGFNIIQWTPVYDAHTYYIYKGIDGTIDFNPLTPNATTPSTTTSWLDTSVDMNKWYYYRVAAVDKSGNVGNLSSHIRVIPVNTQVLNQELEQAKTMIDAWTDLAYQEQQYLAYQAEVNANITRLLNDINYFNNISVLLTPEQFLKINSVKVTLLTAQSKTLFNERRDFLYQALFELRGLAEEYSIGEQSFFYVNNIGNLSIQTSENVLAIKINDKNYYKYTVNKKIINEMFYELKDVTLLFDLPSDAVLVDDLRVEDVKIVENINSLMPGEYTELTYTFYTYSNFVNTAQNGFMTEIIPAEPLKPITGFTVFEKISDSETVSPVIIGLVWGLVLVMGVAYVQKDKIFKLINKKRKIESKNEPKMIEIKIEK